MYVVLIIKNYVVKLAWKLNLVIMDNKVFLIKDE